MKGVILAAGKGARMGKLTKEIPKVMLPVNGRPMLEWHIENLRKFGIKDLYINLYYQPRIVTNYFKDGKKWNVRITYSYEKRLAGTGGALRFLKKYLNERFFLIYGDIFTNMDIASIESFHIAKKADVTIVVHPTDHPEDSDLLDLTKNRKVKKFYFKPHATIPKNAVGIAGIYVFEPSTLAYLPDIFHSDLTKNFLPNIKKNRKKIFCYNTSELIRDIGTLDRYRKSMVI